jgi:UDP-2,3-diacylglucosamine hydrolase
MAFMAGNRDFLVGAAMLKACGVSALPDPTLLSAWDQRVLLTHGDALCLDDEAYQAFRRQVRSESWRRDFLQQPLVAREQQARLMRDASQASQRHQTAADWVDVDTAAAVAWMNAAGSRELIHGHTHRPGSEVLAPGYTRHVLSDWDCDNEPVRAQVLRLTRDGFTRVDLAP